MAKKIIKRTKDGETLYFGTHTDAVLSEARSGKESLTDTLLAIFNSLNNVYTKNETYTQAEVNQIVSAIKQFNVVVASSLPTASASTMNIIYLVPSTHSEQGNVKDEFITIQDGGSYKWEQIGTTAIDLSDYPTTTEMNTAISLALTGKQDTIDDLSDIRSGSELGSTSLQPSDIDDEPVAGSNNLVKSGGVLTSTVKAVLGNEFTYGKKLEVTNNNDNIVVTEVDDDGYLITPYIEVTPSGAGYEIFWHWGRNVSVALKLVVYDSDRQPIGSFSSIGTERTCRIGIYSEYKFYRVTILLSDYTTTYLYDTQRNYYPYIIRNNMELESLTREIIQSSISNYRESEQIFCPANDGRVIEVYSAAFNPLKKYYFKHFRHYNNALGCQMRIYEYTQDDKSDEVLFAMEHTLLADSIMLLARNNPSNNAVYVVYNLKETDTDNLEMEINVPNSSSLELCPSISSYMNRDSINELLLGTGVSLNKKFTSDDYEEHDSNDEFITDFIEVSPTDDQYKLLWTYGTYTGEILVVYDDEKEALGRFRQLSGQNYREVRIGYYSGYRYYRVSIPYSKIFNTSVLDLVTNKYSISYDNILNLSNSIRNSSASGDSVNYEDIVCMPSATYCLKGTENSMYHENYLKYISDQFFVAPASTFISNGWKFLDRCVRVTYSNVADLPMKIVRKDDMAVKKDFTIHGVFGDPSVVTPKVVNCIGDSFTYNGAWFQRIYEAAQGLTFVGMRQSYQTSETLRAEGRGGWTLNTYFTPHDDVTPTHMQPFSPFMHVEGYTYYGVIDFWKVIVNDNSQYTYGTNGFDDYKSWFDSNGFKVNPSVNDLMYDGVHNKYVYWNGSSWADYNGTPSFAFDYSKYISTWNISSPDFVIIMLGKNDFQSNANDAAFAAWSQKMETIIDSIGIYATQVGKDIYIGICTPAVANDSPNNSDNNSPFVGGRNMWIARKKIIEQYDNDTYKGRNVFVVDSGICLDPLYGFSMTEMKPFEFYSGTVRELISTNGVHPSTAGYQQIGVCVSGWIQYIRSL